jgi:hypothetical protein
VNDAQFIVVAQVAWTPKLPPDRFSQKYSPVEIQLRIANLSKRDLVFPTFDTFGLALRTDKGREIKPNVVRDVTVITRPVCIGAGAAYTICRSAQLDWDRKRSVATLLYEDGTGTTAAFEGLTPGKYRLGFSYAWRTPKTNVLKALETGSIWQGSATSGEVRVRLDAPSR